MIVSLFSYLILSLLVVFSIGVINSRSSMYSIINFIAYVCCACIIFIMIGFDYYAILFLILYVGAISLFFVSIIIEINIEKDFTVLHFSFLHRVAFYSLIVIHISFFVILLFSKHLEKWLSGYLLSVFLPSSITSSIVIYLLLFFFCLFFSLYLVVHFASFFFPNLPLAQRRFIVFVAVIIFSFFSVFTFYIIIPSERVFFKPSIKSISHIIFSEYLFPFEVIGLLLLFAVVVTRVLLYSQIFNVEENSLISQKKSSFIDKMMRSKRDILLHDVSSQKRREGRSIENGDL